MSAIDFNGRLLFPITARPRRPLSIRESTASWSIRFSFRTIISGASSSRSLPRRLFLLMTLRYKSFKSEVAKRPPSRGTNGLKSGGKIGNTFKTIHSGLLPDFIKESTNLSLLLIFFNLVCDFVFRASSLRLAASFSSCISARTSCIASAPIFATNSSSPYSSRAS